MKKLVGVLILGLLISGCAKTVSTPNAKEFIDKGCSAWNAKNGTRDYVNASKYFAEAASIDSGYLEVSKSAQALQLVFFDQIDTGDNTAQLTKHLENINAVCGL